jgi:RNA polymerase sigma factor (sigma-70 family)
VTEPSDSADIGTSDAPPSDRDPSGAHTVAWCGHCHKLYGPGPQEASCPMCGAAATAWDTDALFRALAPRLVRHIRSLLRTWNVSDARVDAEGAVNDAFLTMIYQARASDTSIDHPAAWLFVVARREAARAVRRERRIDDGGRQDSVEVHRSVHWSSMTPWSSANDIRGTRLALRAIADLPDRQKVATYLQLVQGWTLEEIAEYLDCAASTAGVHVHRGKVRVREHLDRHWTRQSETVVLGGDHASIQGNITNTNIIIAHRVSYFRRRTARLTFASLAAVAAMFIAGWFLPVFWQLVLAGIVALPVVTAVGTALWDAQLRRRARRACTRPTIRRDTD